MDQKKHNIEIEYRVMKEKTEKITMLENIIEACKDEGLIYCSSKTSVTGSPTIEKKRKGWFKSNEVISSISISVSMNDDLRVLFYCDSEEHKEMILRISDKIRSSSDKIKIIME